MNFRRYWIRIPLLCCAVHAGSSLADDFASNAPEVTASDVRKANTTKLLFAMTYMTKKICSSLGGMEAAQADLAVERFRNAYPKVMQLVEESPYLAVSGAAFESFLDQKKSSSQNRLEVTPNTPVGFATRSCRLSTFYLDYAADQANTRVGSILASQWTAALMP